MPWPVREDRNYYNRVLTKKGFNIETFFDLAPRDGLEPPT